jgi:uncharacterized membrane protein|tara:strand:- start:99 stop:425 length:327 start_codon:yes stop_codon:yes gene_type:complete
MDNKEIELLEDEIQELLMKENRENKHRRYLNIGAIVGIIFMFVSTGNEDEFYSFFGTFGMGIINGVTAICVLMAVIFLIARFTGGGENIRQYEIDRKREKLNKLRKEI